MAGERERRILAVSVLSLSLAALDATFQCCASFVLSIGAKPLPKAVNCSARKGVEEGLKDELWSFCL